MLSITLFTASKELLDIITYGCNGLIELKYTEVGSSRASPTKQSPSASTVLRVLQQMCIKYIRSETTSLNNDNFYLTILIAYLVLVAIWHDKHCKV